MVQTGERKWLRSPVNLILVPVLGLVVATGIVWLLASMTPGWFQLPDSDDAEAHLLGEHVEFRLAEELQLIRPVDAAWRLRITDEAINAWLATRLGPWLQHEGSVWPQQLSWPQVRFSTSGIDVGIRVRDLLSSDRVITLRFHPEVQDGEFRLRPGGVQVGRLPVPFVRSTVDSLLQEAMGRSPESLREFVRVAFEASPMAATIPLVDTRSVIIDQLTLEPGAIILSARTIPGASRSMDR